MVFAHPRDRGLSRWPAGRSRTRSCVAAGPVASGWVDVTSSRADRRRQAAPRLVARPRSLRRPSSSGSRSVPRRAEQAAGDHRHGCPARSSRSSPAGDAAPGIRSRRASAPSSAQRRTTAIGVLLVHDGARPLVSPAPRSPPSPGAAAEHGAAIPVLRSPRRSSASTASGRRRDGRPDRARDGADAAGHPPGRPPRDALDASRRRTREFTDEAALLEAARIAVHTRPGRSSEPQGTRARRPRAWPRRASTRRCRPPRDRARLGDSHPFGPGRRRSGSAASRSRARPRAARPLGRRRGAPRHRRRAARRRRRSATSAAASRPTSSTPRGIASAELLAEVVAATSPARAGAPRSVDLTIRGARPRLGALPDAMRAAIAGSSGST